LLGTRSKQSALHADERAISPFSCAGAVSHSPHPLPWIVRLPLPPRLHQLLELLVAAFGQHDAHGGEKVAGAALRRKALALEAERAARICAWGNRELDRA